MDIGGNVGSYGQAQHGRPECDGECYLQKNLVTDGAISAVTTDPNLLNPWGIAFLPGSPFWISDNGSGLATLYDGLGDIIPLVVTIPWAPGSTVGTPTC